MDSHEVRRQWVERSGEYSPTYYAHYGPDATSEAILEVIEREVGRDVAVLELGCSAGRHLAHLHEAGFTDLSGVEVNGDAFDVLGENYPGLADAGTFHHAAIEDVVGEFADDRFDVVFSVETLQHLHPDADWVFDELVRVADDLVLTVENEGDGAVAPVDAADAPAGTPDGSAIVDVSQVNDEFPLYHRDWRRVFAERGATEVAVRHEVPPGDRDTLRAFRTP